MIMPNAERYRSIVKIFTGMSVGIALLAIFANQTTMLASADSSSAATPTQQRPTPPAPLDKHVYLPVVTRFE